MGIATIQENKVPELRFSGFDGDWKLLTLGDICSIKTGNKDTKNKVDGGEYPFFVRSDNVEKIDSYSWDGEAILTSGDGVGVGKNYHYINGKFDWHQRVYCLKDFKDNFSTKFSYYIFSNKFYRRVLAMSAKNSVDSVRMEMIAGMQLYYPEYIEQQKIADFLGSVDAWLDNLRKQKTALDTYKRGMMQKLFTQQVRFKDENGSKFSIWKTIALSKIATVKKGQQLGRDQMIESAKIPVINGGISASGYTDTSNTRKDTITISEGGNSCGYVSFMTEEFWCGGHCYSVQLPEETEVSTAYLYMFLKYKETEIMRLRVGSGLPNIQKRDIDKFAVSLPNQVEQKKIADFLTSIDQAITVKSEEIDKVEQWKKGLMQKMFV